MILKNRTFILRKLRLTLSLGVLLLSFFFGYTQQTFSYHNPEAGYTKGIDLFEKKLYHAAQDQFLKVSKGSNGASLTSQVNSKYYYALCALRLEQKNGEYLVTKFISENPENALVKDAQFEVALLYYKQKKYRSAVKAFEEVDVYYLSPERLSEFQFKKGYSYFSTNDNEKASQAFFEIKDKNNVYAAPATYYYAHIAYQKKNYETALQSFLKIKDNPEFVSSVPYYISQIYFLQEKYPALIDYATPLLEHANPQHSLEISRMIGEAYYRQAKYTEAVPYLKSYLDNSNLVTRDDFYQLGYSMYRSADFTSCVKYMERVLNIEDALTQNAYYIMADCFLQSGKKQNARNAFRLASQMNYDKEVQENALFSYAKLSYELSIQSDAVNAFQKYKKLFPGSYRMDLANQYIAGVFLTTKNYREALAAMDSMKVKNDQIQGAYQRTAYFRALEFFNDVRYKQAEECFEKSLRYPKDQSLAALAHYWEGEALYNMKNYDAAVKSYSDFLFSPSAINLPLYNVVNYNIAYAYFKKEDYLNASVWFRKYLKSEDIASADIPKHNDALLRIADCSFIKKEYATAAEYYEDALAHRATASDYALFQRGMIYGIQQKPKEKVAMLQHVVDSFPGSPYFDDALYETAKTSFILGDNDKALTLFKKVVSDFSHSSYVSKCLVGIGQIYFNNKQDEEAMTTYMKVVHDFPGSAESRTALMGIKNIYVGQGNAEGFLNYAAGVPFADINKAVQDSVTYEAAEINYMKGDCERSLKDLSAYLDKFPDGSFILNASFYKAECEYRSKMFDKAIHSYESVIASPRSTFTETSLLRAATIYFSKRNFEKALLNYNVLGEVAEVKANMIEATSGKMRCAYYLNQFASAMSSAKMLDTLEKVTPELQSEARLMIGRTAMKISPPDTNLAISMLTGVAKESSERGAEAKFLVASIQHMQAHYQESQKTVFDLVNQVPSYDDWIAKGFVLLADDYLAQGDVFQAKATLQSIISNYDGDDKTVIPSAIERLNAILEKEKNQQDQEMKDKLMSNPDTTIIKNIPEHE